MEQRTRGRPKTAQPLNAAQRKQAQRNKQDIAIRYGSADEWTRAICLRALSSDEYQAFHQAAYEQLGLLLELKR